MYALVLLAATLFLPPDAPPRIVAAHLSAAVARPGQTVSGRVETTSNVASVVARVGTYVQPMRKLGIGRFSVEVKVPRLPFFLKGRWMVSFIAKNTAGVQVVSSLPITIR